MIRDYFKKNTAASCFAFGILAFAVLLFFSLLPDPDCVEYFYLPAVHFSSLDVAVLFTCFIFLLFNPLGEKYAAGKLTVILPFLVLAAIAFCAVLTEFIYMLQDFSASQLIGFLSTLIFFSSFTCFAVSSTKKLQNAFLCHLSVLVGLFGTLLLFVSALLTVTTHFTFYTVISMLLFPVLYAGFYLGIYVQFKALLAKY